MLHTWGQRLNYHFHIHIVMTAGGLSPDKSRWIAIDQDDMETRKAELAGCFKQQFLKGLRRLFNQEQLRFPLTLPDRASIDSMLSIIEQKDWIADVGATPQKYRDSGQRRMSLGYVGKYVAGTAIGDGRLISDEDGMVTFRAFDYRTGQSIEIKMPGPQFVEAFLRHVLPARLHRCRTAGIFAPQGRTARLDLCRALLGEPTAEQLAEADDEQNPLGGDADDQQEQGSYLPCPVCGEKTRQRFEIEARIICELLHVAATVVAMLRTGKELSIAAAIIIVARAGCQQRPMLRGLIPNCIDSHNDLMLTTETIVQDRLRRRQAERQLEGSVSKRGPP